MNRVVWCFPSFGSRITDCSSERRWDKYHDISMFCGAYGDARMPNWPHRHRTPLPRIATTGLCRDKGGISWYMYANLIKMYHFWGFSSRDTAIFPKLGRKHRFLQFLTFLTEETLLSQMQQTTTRSNLPFLFYGGVKLAEIFTLFEA